MGLHRTHLLRMHLAKQSLLRIQRVIFLSVCLLYSEALSPPRQTFLEEIMREFKGANMSVLSRVRKSHIKSEPYPHLVISPALPTKLYKALDLAFPSTGSILHAARVGNLLKGRALPNTRHKIQAPQALQVSSLQRVALTRTSSRTTLLQNCQGCASFLLARRARICFEPNHIRICVKVLQDRPLAR